MRGKRYSDDCVVERDPWGGPRIILWGGIELFKRFGTVQLFFFSSKYWSGRRNSVTAAQYINQVLQPHLGQHIA